MPTPSATATPTPTATATAAPTATATATATPTPVATATATPPATATASPAATAAATPSATPAATASATATPVAATPDANGGPLGGGTLGGFGPATTRGARRAGAAGDGVDPGHRGPGGADARRARAGPLVRGWAGRDPTRLRPHRGRAQDRHAPARCAAAGPGEAHARGDAGRRTGRRHDQPRGQRATWIPSARGAAVTARVTRSTRSPRSSRRSLRKKARRTSIPPANAKGSPGTVTGSGSANARSVDRPLASAARARPARWQGPTPLPVKPNA